MQMPQLDEAINDYIMINFLEEKRNQTPANQDIMVCLSRERLQHLIKYYENKYSSLDSSTVKKQIHIFETRKFNILTVFEKDPSLRHELDFLKQKISACQRLLVDVTPPLIEEIKQEKVTSFDNQSTSIKKTEDHRNIKKSYLIRDWLDSLIFKLYDYTLDDLRNLMKENIILCDCGDDIILYEEDKGEYSVTTYSDAVIEDLFSFELAKLKTSKIRLSFEAMIIKISYHVNHKMFMYKDSILDSVHTV